MKARIVICPSFDAALCLRVSESRCDLSGMVHDGKAIWTYFRQLSAPFQSRHLRYSIGYVLIFGIPSSSIPIVYKPLETHPPSLRPSQNRLGKPHQPIVLLSLLGDRKLSHQS